MLDVRINSYICAKMLQITDSIVMKKKFSIENIRSLKKAISKTPVVVSINAETSNFVGLRTKHPVLAGLHCFVTLKGDIRPYMRYLNGTDVTDMASDWNMVGYDILSAMDRLKQQ